MIIVVHTMTSCTEQFQLVEQGYAVGGGPRGEPHSATWRTATDDGMSTRLALALEPFWKHLYLK